MGLKADGWISWDPLLEGLPRQTSRVTGSHLSLSALAAQPFESQRKFIFNVPGGGRFLFYIVSINQDDFSCRTGTSRNICHKGLMSTTYACAGAGNPISKWWRNKNLYRSPFLHVMLQTTLFLCLSQSCISGVPQLLWSPIFLLERKWERVSKGQHSNLWPLFSLEPFGFWSMLVLQMNDLEFRLHWRVAAKLIPT